MQVITVTKSSIYFTAFIDRSLADIATTAAATVALAMQIFHRATTSNSNKAPRARGANEFTDYRDLYSLDLETQWKVEQFQVKHIENRMLAKYFCATAFPSFVVLSPPSAVRFKEFSTRHTSEKGS